MNTVTKRNFSRKTMLSAGLGSALALAACGGGGGGGGGGPVALDDPNALMQALADKVGSDTGVVQLKEGAPPANAGEAGPKVTEGISESEAIPGDEVAVPVRVDGNPALSNLFAKITGATNLYFQVPIGEGDGKSGLQQAVPVAKQIQQVEVVLLNTLDLRVDLPENLDLTTGDEICFDLSVQQEGGSVSTVAQPCIAVRAQRPQVIDDQPPGAEMPERLNGTWVSSCLDINDFTVDQTTFRAARIGLTFAAEGLTYAESVFAYTAADCSAGESISAPQSSGTYVIGGEDDSNQNGLRTRAIDFVPAQPEGALPCFNRLRIVDTNGDDVSDGLFFGVPRTSYRSTGNALPNDCRAEDTRPAYVLTSLPFTKR